jgi:hypothetical protein
VHDEQMLMWDLWWQAGRATAPGTGPLTWVVTLDGRWLAGNRLPVADQASPGGTP